MITVHFSNEQDTLSWLICSIIRRGALYEKPPSSYSIVDGVPVLIYTGIENELTFDEECLSQLKKEAYPYLFDDLSQNKRTESRIILNVPPNFNPEVWRVKFVDGKLVSKVRVYDENE